MSPSIRIAAGLIVDASGRCLLVRKRGTAAFMQAGGKIEPHESAAQALAREIGEELGLKLEPHQPEYLGAFSAPAANETGRMVDAECFYIAAEQFGADLDVSPAAEIEEIAWVTPHDVRLLLAFLTRDHLLPIARLRFAPNI